MKPSKLMDERECNREASVIELLDLLLGFRLRVFSCSTDSVALSLSPHQTSNANSGGVGA